MHQTQYKTGPKGSFFPSTTTATTNGSSGQATSDPRRTTDAGSRQLSVSNQSGNNQFELNLPLRFGKNQIKLNGGHIQRHNITAEGNPVVTNVSQTTKNAW